MVHLRKQADKMTIAKMVLPGPNELFDFFKDQYTDIEKKRFCFELIDSSINTLGEAFKTAIPMDQRALARFLADSVEVGQSPYIFSSQQLQKLVNDSPDRVELCNDLYHKDRHRK